jgi:hypothetical protein
MFVPLEEIAMGIDAIDATPDAITPSVELSVVSCLLEAAFARDNLGEGIGAKLVR